MRITLDDIAERAENVHQYGHYIAIICPFHEDTSPSMLVYQDGWYRCLACGATGRITSLYNALGGRVSHRYHAEGRYPPVPSVSDEDQKRIDLFWSAHYILLGNEGLNWYYKMRGVEGRIEPCKLGWYDGWYTIPVITEDGEIAGGVMRSGPTIQEATGLRFFIPKGQESMLYCPDWSILKRRKKLAIVYGMFDALALSELGFAVVTTTSGKDSFNPEWLDFWRKPIVIIPDKGEELTAKKLAGQLDWRGSVYMIKYKNNLKDPADYMKETRCREDLLKELTPLLR